MKSFVKEINVELSSVQSLSQIQLFVTPRAAKHQASLCTMNTRSLLKLMSVELEMTTNHFTLCRPLLLLPSIISSIRVFSEKSLWIRWPKYWSFIFNVSTSNEYSGLISYRMEWFWSPCSPRNSQESSQHHSSRASILWSSAFFRVQLSQPYMTTGKTIVLTRWIFVGKLMSTFLYPVQFGHRFSSKDQASFNIMALVTICSDFGAPQNKISHCFHCFIIYLPWSDGTRCHDLTFLNVEL